MNTCAICGATVTDPRLHEAWHARLRAALEELERQVGYANADPDDWTGPLPIITTEGM